MRLDGYLGLRFSKEAKVMKREQGFSLIEVVIAMLVIAVGMLALSAALVIGVTLPGRARQQEIAKHMASAIMESIIAAKESPRPGFTSFASIDYAPAGRFVAGVAPMLEAGPDGVYGTCDDGQPSPGTVGTCPGFGPRIVQLTNDPGPDGNYTTTADNRTRRLVDFTREVVITNDSGGEVKNITVRVTYGTPTGVRETVTLMCRLTNFATFN